MTLHQSTLNAVRETARPQTLAASAGVARDPAHRSVAPPLYLSATYGWESAVDKPAYDYARSGNPTRAALESAIAELEGAERAVVTSSGMSAIDVALSLLRPGDTVLAPSDCYGGTHRLLKARAARGQFKVEFVDLSDKRVAATAIRERPKLVLIETPSNPLLRITDIEYCALLAREAGAITLADNTFLSPAQQRPLDLGCDLVCHSTTKYLNGHSDVVGGVIAARNAGLGEELAWWANATGVTGAPFDSYQTLRGLRTLFVRIKQAAASAQAVAAELAADDRVERVYFPGLESHEGHALACRQQTGFGAMLSVEFAENVDVIALLRGLNLFTTAESLGGFESLACIPALMTHASMDAAARAEAGISDGLVRLSIGLEDPADLLADLDRALGAACAAPSTPKARVAA